MRRTTYSRSIGIEMVGFAHNANTWNSANLAALVELSAWLAVEYDVPVVRPPGNAYDYPNDRFNAPGFVAHAQIQPWNRSDPGPYFPWNDFLAQVQQRIGPEPASYVYVDFEGGDRGNFTLAPGYSGSTQGINAGASTNVAVQGIAFEGDWSQRLTIVNNPAVNNPSENPDGGWFVRHISGQSANRSQNHPRPTEGFVGFWAMTETPGIDVSLAIDNTNNVTADRGVQQSLIADGQWHLYEWNLDDNSQWEGWFSGDGIINTVDFTIDSLMFFGPADDAVIYIDSIAHFSGGSLWSMLGIVPGDTNGDGIVDMTDLNNVKDNFGATGEPGTPDRWNPLLTGDANGDGIVDIVDYNYVKNHFGDTLPASSAPAVVPEPTSVALLLIGLAIVGNGLFLRTARFHADEQVLPLGQD